MYGRSAETRQALEIVRTEMGRLPEDQRVLVAMVAIDGLSYQQAAETLSIPIGTVMNRLAHTRRKLADPLERPRQPQSRDE